MLAQRIGAVFFRRHDFDWPAFKSLVSISLICIAWSIRKIFVLTFMASGQVLPRKDVNDIIKNFNNDYDVICKMFWNITLFFPPLKRLEESRVVLENRSQASQWFQNVTSTT